MRLPNSLNHLAPSARTLERVAGRGLAPVALSSIELVASPFATFQDVDQFYQRVETLPSVQEVHLRSMDRGVLQMRVECSGTAVLLDEISAGFHGPIQVVAHDQHCLEIQLHQGANPAQTA